MREDGLTVRFLPDRVVFEKDGGQLVWSKESCDTGALDRYDFGYAILKLSDLLDAHIPVEREGWKLSERIPVFHSDCEESKVFWMATGDGKLVYLSLYEDQYDSFVYVKAGK